MLSTARAVKEVEIKSKNESCWAYKWYVSVGAWREQQTVSIINLKN